MRRRPTAFRARADPGRRLRQPAQEPPPGAPCAGCRNPARKRIARTSRPSPISSPRPASTIWRDRMVGQGRRPGAFADPPSRRPSRIWRQGACGVADKAEVGEKSARRLRSARANARRFRQRADRGGEAAMGRAETTDAFLQGLAGGDVLASRTRTNGWPPTMQPCGRREAARARRWPVRDEGARRDGSSATSRRDLDSPEAGSQLVCITGVTHWFAGRVFRSALETSEQGAAAASATRARRRSGLPLRTRRGGCGDAVISALTLWPLGHIGRAVPLVSDAEARIAELAHVADYAHLGRSYAAMFALMRRGYVARRN